MGMQSYDILKNTSTKYLSHSYRRSKNQIVIIKASKRIARGKRDTLTGRRRNKANAVSFSNKKSRVWQEINIQNQMVYWPEGLRSVKLRISSRTIRSIQK